MRIPSRMRAAVCVGPDSFLVKNIDVPEPGPDEVLIRVEACAVCSSDVAMIRSPWPAQPPYGEFIPGHDYAGTVTALGADVDEVMVGDRVAVEVHHGCGHCHNCLRGRYTACLNWGRLERGHRANGMTTAGGFAQYTVNHVSTVHRLDDSVPFEVASLLTNLGCVLYGLELTGGFVAGDRVAVVGEGAIGLIAVALARLLEAESVTLLGLDPFRLSLGERFGADRAIDVGRCDPVPLLKANHRDGVDLAIETSGSPQGMAQAALLARWAGSLLVFGIPEGRSDIDFHDFIRANKTMYTVRGEGLNNCRRAASLLNRKRLDLSSLITHRFPLELIEAAFNTHTGKLDNALKVVIHPNA